MSPLEPEPKPTEAVLTLAPSRARRHRLPQFTRIGFFVVGWTLVAVGLAGLVLPGIQGVVTILAGLSVLSVVSRTAHGWTRQVLRRWPGLRRKMERLRWRLRQRFGGRAAAAARLLRSAKPERGRPAASRPYRSAADG